MGKFESLDTRHVNERELELVQYWKDINLLEESLKLREECPRFVFFEGPPTANGKPGIHHVVSRTFKDEVCRYNIMKGKYVERKAGWDTHGLPVEIEVEKKLGLHNKKDIEAFGVQRFNEECRKSVFQYESLWRKMTERMGYEIDLDHPYITLDNDYIESVWNILDGMFKDDLLYEGHKILPYCPRCGTGLASHEVAQGYENIKTVTAYVKFKRKDKDEFFLAWTTTPWTLPSNVSLTVHEDIEYVLILDKETNEKLWLAKDLLEEVLKDAVKEYEVLDSVRGKDLQGIEYEQLIPMIEVGEKAFFVTCAPYVTTTDGTGIVHTAPAFGEDDYKTGTKYGLPTINPVDEEGKFKVGYWAGENVFDADPKIIEWLKENGKLFKRQRVEHNYPHCWRCHTPLIYYSKPSWYINTTAFKDKIIANNDTIHWFPDFIGEKRFGNWLENLCDWALSRNRYWGTPLPIWKCDQCGHVKSIGSRKELVARSVEKIDETIDLHRPYVDDCHLKCDQCSGQMTRYQDVIDVWFDSGSMPFAQRHYPFEHTEDFDHYFPADFICEGVDQTRGWFNSLLIISTYLTGKAPYKNVLVNDMVLDKHGKKMSKHKGNTLDPFQLFEVYGADVVRFYANYVSDPWVPTKFDEEGLKEIESKYIRSIRNVYNFFSLYVASEDMHPDKIQSSYEDRDEMDKWILSRFHSLVRFVDQQMEIYEVTKVAKALMEFVVEDLSNWYIRRSRRRFWMEDGKSKEAAFRTTYEILLDLSRLIAPFTPFIAEEIFRKLSDRPSVHLEDYPVVREDFILSDLEQKIELVRTIVSLGRSSREQANLKVRQPLQAIIIDSGYKDTLQDVLYLIKEELNIKEVRFAEDITTYMHYEVKPNFKVAGPVMGKNIGGFTKYLKEQHAHALLQEIKNNEIEIELAGETYTIDPSFLDVRILAKEGFDVQTENDVYVVLDTNLTDDLIKEGFVREFTSKIQQERKRQDLDVSDRIHVAVDGPETVISAIREGEASICEETLTKEIEYVSVDENETDLNGHTIHFKVTKI
ncbi:MAG: isoleucine--tRNA ligase [Tissierellia bacterium]|nr:isoleucine--tRNA ligase [Tissierellia bacterium]